MLYAISLFVSLCYFSHTNNNASNSCIILGIVRPLEGMMCKKSEKISAFGGIFFVLDKFDSILSSVIDSHLGLRRIMGTGF